MDTLSTPWAASVDSGGAAETPRMMHTAFSGDAKNQVPDGINTTPIGFSAIWHLRAADAELLLAFLRAHVAQTFLWTMPRETTPRRWQAGQWERTVADDFDHHKVSVSFEEMARP
jgi:phage-related protein